MSATQEESDIYYTKDAGVTRRYFFKLTRLKLICIVFPAPPPHFISEIFFLACTYLHIGPLYTMKEHKDISRQIQQMNRGIADMEADTTWRGVSLLPFTLNSRLMLSPRLLKKLDNKLKSIDTRRKEMNTTQNYTRWKFNY